MTVTATTSRWDYSGDGSTDVFAYDNKIFVTSDLQVFVAGALQTLTTDYTVSGAGTDGGGNVTFVSPPADGAAVVILRVVPNTQPAELPASGAFPSDSVEDSLDRRAIVSQQEAEKVSRTLKFLESDVNLPSATLPALASLKGKVLSFNSSTGAPEAIAFGDISALINVMLSSEADNDFLVFDGTNWINETPSEVRTTLGIEQSVQDFEDVASATTTDIGAASSRNVRITGTTTITGLGTADAGTYRRVRFAAALTLTHNGTSLILPGSANITTAADDTATFISLGSGNWICTAYKRASGLPVAFVDEDDMVSDSAVLVPTQQSVKAYVDANGGGFKRGGSIITASGTGGGNTNLGGVSGPDILLVAFNQVSQDGSDDVLVQVGDSGGMETTGYKARTQGFGVSGLNQATSTSGFVVKADATGDLLTGALLLIRVTGNTWVGFGLFDSENVNTVTFAGSKTLSGTLDRIGVALSGAANFDGGAVQVIAGDAA